MNHDINLTVGEAADGGLAKVNAQDPGNLNGEAQVTVATEQLESTGMPLCLGGGSLETHFFGSHVGRRILNLGRRCRDVGGWLLILPRGNGLLLVNGSGSSSSSRSLLLLK